MTAPLYNVNIRKWTTINTDTDAHYPGTDVAMNTGSNRITSCGQVYWTDGKRFHGMNG